MWEKLLKPQNLLFPHLVSRDMGHPDLLLLDFTLLAKAAPENRETAGLDKKGPLFSGPF
jgi:hypothetical protein